MNSPTRDLMGYFAALDDEQEALDDALDAIRDEGTRAGAPRARQRPSA